MSKSPFVKFPKNKHGQIKMSSVKILNQIYKFVARHGEMKKEFGAWVHRLSIGNKEIVTFKQGMEWVLFINGVVDVTWDNSGVYAGLFRQGNPKDLEKLWDELTHDRSKSV